MAESFQRIFQNLLIMNELPHILNEEHPSGEQFPRHPSYPYLREELNSMPLMKRLVKELMAYPELMWADVGAYLDHVQKNGHCLDHPNRQEQPKSSARAAEIRRIGNEMYGLRKYTDALRQYNESICFAPNDSEHLAIGFANRSAVFYDQGEYNLALANIVLAKEHKYPDRLMPKLLARESSCRKMIDKIHKIDLEKNAIKVPTLTFCLEANRRIPFLAKGIAAQKLPNDGSRLLAKEDFKVGDVILQEKPMRTSVLPMHKYISCNHCLAENMFHLIPCPNCTLAMYCNETCLMEAHGIHRFECGITAELRTWNACWVGPRMFFYALTLFGDDVEKMMEFCQANNESGTTFFDVDYTNFDPREEFKAFIGPQSSSTKVNPLWDNVLQLVAAIFYTTYMKVPLVRSLVTNEVQRMFMLQSFLSYMGLLNDKSIHSTIEGQLYPIASSFELSDNNANTVVVQFGGQLKLIVLRPVRPGEPFLISYGSCWEEGTIGRCSCCYEEKIQMILSKMVPNGNISIVSEHLETLKPIVADKELSITDKLKAVQQFIQRYGALDVQDELSDVISIFRVLLTVAHENEIKAALARDFSSKGGIN